MKIYKSDKVRFIAGLILIVIVYSWNGLFFITENQEWMKLPKLTFHLIRFGVTIVVYFIGTYHLGKIKESWMSTIWHLVHVSGLIIITSLGLFDWFIMEIPRALKSFAHNVQEILISPVLYVAMGLLNKSLNKEANT
ncbi:hypothetical protein PW52_02785 [Tamlana sedimentorum]|uniref:Uncharacterized protein n=1 Tax=Neotamlana sedimentorum TaxID=1435349 RepID=A0A0D7WBY8_9FLAO|nr:hypothetical protein [Tamlana sedimentorum]KJD36589.1 hypothetical protein PW52_02785 [Tamlana sedimentorum]